jgi:hypothetical protein
MTKNFRQHSAGGLVVVLCAAACLGIYLATVQPDVLGGDIGEFQLAVHIMALPHPTGYPLHMLLGKLWTSLLPIGTVAWRMNVLSAVAGCAAVALTGATLLRITGSALGAAIAALALGLGAVMWEQSVLGDKYALSATMLALLLFAAQRFDQLRLADAPGAHRALLWLCAAAGLALAHHRSVLVFAPFLLAYVLWRDRSLVRTPQRLAGCAAAFVAPLMLYAYLPFAAQNAWDTSLWQDPGSLQGWINYLLDRNFLAEVKPTVNVFDNIAAYATSAYTNFGPVLLALAALGAIQWIARAQIGSRALAIAIIGGATAQAMLTAGYNVPRQWLFYLPSFVVIALCAGVGAATLLHLRLPGGFTVPRALICVALCALVASTAAPRWIEQWRVRRLAIDDGGEIGNYRIDLRNGYQARRFATHALPTVAPAALILADWEQATPLWYAQLVEGSRPDVDVRYPTELLTPALAAQGPVYIARTYPTLGEPFRFSAEGSLLRVRVTPNMTAPTRMTPNTARFESALALVGHDQLPRIGSTTLALNLHFRALSAQRPDLSYSLRLFGPDGAQLWQKDQGALALGMMPTSRMTEGEYISDYVEIPLPEARGRYTLRMLVYEQRDGSFRNLVTDAPDALDGLLAPVTVLEQP